MLTIVIQAGGESRRMGQDKGLASFLRKTLIERVIGRVSHLADELIVVTNKVEAYKFLGLPLVSDRLPGRGALGGLYTALSAAQNPIVGVVACDMPFASGELLREELRLLEEGGHDAVIPKTEGGTEPFHAVYRRDSCLPLVEKALRAGLWRVDSWFGEAKIRYLVGEEIGRLDPQGLAFLNANTPEDLAEAERAAAVENQKDPDKYGKSR